MANGFKLVWWWWRVWGPGLSEAVSFKMGWEACIGDSQERGRWELSIPGRWLSRSEPETRESAFPGRTRTM